MLDLFRVNHGASDLVAYEHSVAIERGTDALESLADRLAFVRPPFDLANVARSADAFGAELILLDYIQRMARPSAIDRLLREARSVLDGMLPDLPAHLFAR